MALVSAVTDIPNPIERIRYPEIDISGLNLAGEIEAEDPNQNVQVDSSSSRNSDEDDDGTVYVAVGKNVEESKLTVSWAVRNSGARRIAIVHVHQPAQKIPISLGTKFSIHSLEENFVKAYHDKERQNMHKVLDKYISVCVQAGVAFSNKLVIEMDCIEEGILKLVSQHGIRKLVMGAAANKLYSKKMLEPKSKKAIYVRQGAPGFCHIWFVCKGHLICTRDGKLDRTTSNTASPRPQPNLHAEARVSTSSRTSSVSDGQSGISGIDGLISESPRANQDTDGPSEVSGYNRLNPEGSTDGWDGLSRRSPSVVSQFSTCSSSEAIDASALVSSERTETSRSGSGFPHQVENAPRNYVAGSMNDELYDRLDQFMTEAEISRREAYEESIRRRKAEKEAFEAFRRAKTSESMYMEELRQRKEIEEALVKGKEENEKIKMQIDALLQDLRFAQEQKCSLECQIADSDKMVQELEEKMFSAVELLQKYKKERDELQVECDNALRVAEELRSRQNEEASSTSTSRFFFEFPFSDIEEATRNFDPLLKIGEGGYGSIYGGILRHTPVAIKMLHPNSLQGPTEFQQEVNILSKLRHPNLVTLIGACSEAWTLIYEYVPNGSLEDRLSCKDNTPPLSWQTRIRIAAELCSVLIFLHSCSPQGIVHGDLKPANILLDANYVCKLSDFGICRVISEDEFSNNNTTLCCRTDPKGTFVYMDPEFLATGELTPKSDVYSFGIILLRLLTGRPALGIIKEVQYSLDKGNLKDLLDPTAGDWPFVQAKQLAHLAMSCCEMNRRNRPDLVSEVWRVIEPMRVSCRPSSSGFGSEERCQIPSYFICPIFQEVMQDPVVAADGFTYEAEALKGWLDSGHDTSPMTNLKLAHTNLVPNHALRSAIQEWLQQP